MQSKFKNSFGLSSVPAAEAGKDIFCEKPLANNLTEAKEMLVAVRKAGVKHMTAFNYRRVPAIQLAKKLIEEGKLGKIYHYRATYLQDWIIDPIASVRKLGKAIYHVHAKDTRIDDINTSVNGVLDTKPYSDEVNRSWIFRTVGYGHDYEFWKAFVSNLRMVGYDHVLSIEHEDSLMSVNEGFGKAVSFLKEILLTEKVGEMWWA